MPRHRSCYLNLVLQRNNGMTWFQSYIIVLGPSATRFSTSKIGRLQRLPHPVFCEPAFARDVASALRSFAA